MALSIPIITEYDGKGVKKAIAEFKQLETNSAKAQFILTKSAAPAAAALTTVAYAAMDAVKAASNMQESMSKVNVIFGASSLKIDAFAKTAARSIGMSRQSVMDAAGTFGIFGKSAGLTGDALSDFSNKFTTLAADLASFNNTTPEDAIQAIGSALRGEYEPIRRYGVLLNEATLKQEAMRLGIFKGSGALTAQQKILAAQSAIFQQTDDAQGDYNRTSDSLANTQKQLKARFEDLQVSVGQKLLPVMQDLLGVMTDTAKWADEHPSLMKKAGNALSTFGGLIARQVTRPFIALKEVLSLIPAETAKVFTGADISRFQKMASTFRGAADGATELTDTQKELIKTLKEKLASAVDTARQKVEAIKDEMKNFASGIAGTISSFASLTSSFDKATLSEQAYQDALKERAAAYEALDMAKVSGDTKDYADALKRVADAEGAVTKATAERKNYSQIFAEQIAAAKSFAGSLTQLSQMGLGAAGIQQLLDLGPIAGAAVAKDLLAGVGGLTIGGLNQSLAELNAAGMALGGQVGQTVYGADLMTAENQYSAIRGARVTGVNNITINVNGGDPQAVVNALRRYMQVNGSVPIRVSA